MQARTEYVIKEFTKLAPLHHEDMKSQIMESLHVCRTIADKRGNEDVGVLAKQCVPLFERILVELKSTKKSSMTRKSTKGTKKGTRHSKQRGSGVVYKTFVAMYMVVTLLTGAFFYSNMPNILTHVSPTMAINVLDKLTSNMFSSIYFWKTDPDSAVVLPEPVLRETLKRYNRQLIVDSDYAKQYRAMKRNVEEKKKKIEIDVRTTWMAVSQADVFQDYKHMLESQVVAPRDAIPQAQKDIPNLLVSFGSLFGASSVGAADVAYEMVQSTPVHVQDELEWFQDVQASVGLPTNYTALYSILSNVTSSFYPTVNTTEPKGRIPYSQKTLQNKPPKSVPPAFLTYSKPKATHMPPTMDTKTFLKGLGRPYKAPPVIHIVGDKIRMETSDFDTFIEQTTALLNANAMDASVVRLLTHMIRIRYYEYIIYYITTLDTMMTFAQADSQIEHIRSENNRNLDNTLSRGLQTSEKNKIEEWFFYLEGKYVKIPDSVFGHMYTCVKTPTSCKMLTVRDVRVIEAEFDIYNANSEDVLVRLLFAFLSMSVMLGVPLLANKVLDSFLSVIPNFRGLTESRMISSVPAVPALTNRAQNMILRRRSQSGLRRRRSVSKPRRRTIQTLVNRQNQHPEQLQLQD